MSITSSTMNIDSISIATIFTINEGLPGSRKNIIINARTRNASAVLK